MIRCSQQTGQIRLETNLQTLPRPAVEEIGTLRLTAFWQLAPLLLLWLMAGWGLADHWRLNPQYQYGWIVPALAAYAAYDRWRTRPPPEPPVAGGLWLACLSVALLLPAWVSILPNTAWPLVHWIFVAQVSVATFGVIAAMGGRRWVRHFAVPILFMFTAVPWPDLIESPIMSLMRQTAASVAVFGLDLLGVTALQHGNVLEVAGGAVGVEEACSGIRSLQGSLTASLILGEFFRFNAPRRVLLVALSIAAAFATNLFRVGFLAWNAAKSGTASIDQWHDPAGMTGLLVCVVVIWAVAFRLDVRGTSVPVSAHVPPPRPLPRWFVPTATVWIVITIISAELWYHDPSPDPKGQWAVRVPASSKPISISPNVWVQLRYDSAIAASCVESGRTWTLFFFDWEFGPMFSRISAQNHRPDICLPATGFELQQDRGTLVFQVDGVPLPFHAYSFCHGKELMFVYHGVWPFRSERGVQRGPLAEGKYAASLRSVLWRERRMGQQSAELFISGCANSARADDAFTQFIPQLLRRNPN
jgi:exosortase